MADDKKQTLLESTAPEPLGIPTGTYGAALQSLEAKGVSDPLDINKQYDDMLGSAASVASSLLEGGIPEDVQKQVMQVAAEKSLSSGLGAGSQAARNLTVRDLGLTSLSLVERGLSAAQNVFQLSQTQRQSSLDYLSRLRETDLQAQGLLEGTRQTNLEAKINLFGQIGNTLGAYHQTAAGLIASGEAEQSDIGRLSADYQNLLSALRSSLGDI